MLPVTMNPSPLRELVVENAQQRITLLTAFFFFAKNPESEGKVSPRKLRHPATPHALTGCLHLSHGLGDGPTRTARWHGQQNMPTQHSIGECMPLRLCPATGDSRALALAKADKKVAVSSFHRLPTSAARTTKRARPPSPDSSG